MIRWVLVMMIATVLNPAVAQPVLRERAVTSPSAAIKAQLPTVVMNDGTYALVDHKSASDRQKTKKAEASCPTGMKAISAGYSAASGAGEPKDYRLILSKPNDAGTGWAVYARFDGKGDSLAADYDWELRIRVVCVKLG